MITSRWLGAAAALSILSLVACDAANQPGQSSDASGGQPAAVAKLADIEMAADTSYLTAEEREVANLLIQVAELINPIYLRQAAADNPRIRDEIAAKNDPALLARFDQMMGPWDEMEEDKPFFGSSRTAGRRGLLSRGPDQGAVRRLSRQASGRGRGADQSLHGGQAAGG